MADCGATGSALDRSAARLITSAIGGRNGNETAAAAARAGSAISSFMGGVATTGNGTAPLGLMPAAPPQAIVQNRMRMGAGVVELPVGSVKQAQMDQSWIESNNMTSHATMAPQQAAMTMHAAPMNMQMPMNMNPQMNYPNHPMNQMHANMNMQMSNMMQMQQQMAMMQMAQQQQQQHQQQQQQQQQVQEMKQRQRQESQQKQQELNDNLQEKISANATTTRQNQSQPEQNLNDWHQSLEDDFQSFLDTYKDGVQTDAATTAEELGHDGNVEGASIERLAAAWAEAEEEFAADKYSNLEDQYYADDEDQHYEFSQESEAYGRQEQNQDEYIDLMSEGMRYFEAGDTAEAIKCFESELRNVDGDNSDAWLMLGKCHAENDEDRKAIICLENAVERDPYSSEALLALGVSYVNELDHEKALKNLNNWVTHNPSYAGLDLDVLQEGEASIAGESGPLMKLKSLLHQAKRYDEVNGNIDSSVDVLETLGVVCNVSRDYEEAVECLQAATSARPDDHQLWNKLGATLANSNRSEEAQHAYQKALECKPKYARSWLNLAISHSNLQNYHESARCYLQTLSLNPNAVHIWSYLRIALTCSEQWDLLPHAASQDLAKFKEHYDFVQYS